MAHSLADPPVISIEGKNGQKAQVGMGKVDELLLRADTLMRLKNGIMFEEAKKAYEKVIELEPDNKMAFRGLARALIMLGDEEKAREIFKGMGADPDVAIPQARTELQMMELRPPE